MRYRLISFSLLALCLHSPGWAAGNVNAASAPVSIAIDSAPGKPWAARFHVAKAQIISPDGNPFIARGINIPDYAMSYSGNGRIALSLFPGLNFVRLNCQGTPNGAGGGLSADTPATLNAFITVMTNAGVVVEIEDHYTDLITAGNTDGIPTGTALKAELQWYAALATAFKGNPYVWFGSMNEPGGGYSLNQTDKNNIALQQIAIYDSIRNAGNANPILLENGGGFAGDNYAGFRKPYLSTYSAMTNVIWDTHYYGWITHYSTDTALLAGSIANAIADARSVRTANGAAPVIIGEYGTSTNGSTIDANGTQAVTAVQLSGYGSAAWSYGAGASDKLLATQAALTSYGAEVAAFIAGHRPKPWTDGDGS